MLERIKTRLIGLDYEVSDILLEELITTAKDRLCIRLGVDELPKVFESICVEVVIKMFRRMYYEGITSESAGSISTSFVDDILAEYESEITRYGDNQAEKGENTRVVHFI